MRCCWRCLTSTIRRHVDNILADNRRDILEHEARFRLQKASRDGLE